MTTGKTDKTDTVISRNLLCNRRIARCREREKIHDDAAFEYHKMARDARAQRRYLTGLWNEITSQYHVILACHYSGLAKATEVIG